jgi:DNA-binding NarL/FixJ family response regulator
VPIRIVIADDHALMRDGLKMILGTQMDFIVVGEAANGSEAITKAGNLRPDVILMDIGMPIMNGTEACRKIHSCFSETKIIMLSMHNTKEHVFQSFRAGASGYLLKQSVGSEIIEAVRAVLNNKPYYGMGVEPPMDYPAHCHNAPAISPLENLSNRERQVLQYVVDGKTSAEIGTLLSLSSKSVDTYRSRIMVKLNTKNVVHLVNYAIQNGITPDV